MDKIIYHITEKDYFQNQMISGEYRSATFEQELFIHLSTETQVAATLERYYAGKTGLVLLKIEVEKLRHELKYELASNGEYYPHLYGPINQEAIVAVNDIV
jgi:uncharacterized protein (DUF952 family)